MTIFCVFANFLRFVAIFSAFHSHTKRRGANDTAEWTDQLATAAGQQRQQAAAATSAATPAERSKQKQTKWEKKFAKKRKTKKIGNQETTHTHTHTHTNASCIGQSFASRQREREREKEGKAVRVRERGPERSRIFCPSKMLPATCCQQHTHTQRALNSSFLQILFCCEFLFCRFISSRTQIHLHGRSLSGCSPSPPLSLFHSSRDPLYFFLFFLLRICTHGSLAKKKHIN